MTTRQRLYRFTYSPENAPAERKKVFRLCYSDKGAEVFAEGLRRGGAKDVVFEDVTGIRFLENGKPPEK